MAHLAGRESLRLRVLQANRDLAGGKVSAPLAMIFLAGARDVDGLGLGVLLGRCLLRGNRERNRAQ